MHTQFRPWTNFTNAVTEGYIVEKDSRIKSIGHSILQEVRNQNNSVHLMQTQHLPSTNFANGATNGYRFNKEEKNYSRKLDEILFKNIEESRLIYKKIQLFGDLLVDAVKSKTLCDKDVDELKEENLMLKAVIARSQVNKKIKEDKKNSLDMKFRNKLKR